MIPNLQLQEEKLDEAIRAVIAAYNRFQLPKYWGTGKRACADGTKWEMYEQNLLAEYHIRYGGYGELAIIMSRIPTSRSSVTLFLVGSGSARKKEQQPTWLPPSHLKKRSRSVKRRTLFAK
jgi:hypothetical protein